MALEKEIQMSKATAPIYPLLENAERAQRAANTKADLMYRLNRTNDLLNELKQEKKHYETVYQQ